MNATKIVSGGSTGGALAAVIIYVLSRFHINLTAEDGALTAVGLVAVCAFIVHNGVAGAFALIWHGQPKPSAATPTVPPAE